jgi:hypothetical protein
MLLAHALLYLLGDPCPARLVNALNAKLFNRPGFTAIDVENIFSGYAN